MKKMIDATKVEEMTDFPYYANGWGYDLAGKGTPFLDFILYTIDDPEAPDGMSYVMDIEGMKEWYDQVESPEDHALYECPTVYDYIACEIGRYVTPVKGIAMTPVVFINCRREPFVDEILGGLKQYETRNRNTLKRFLGQRILLAETGKGSPLVKGSAVIAEIVEVYTREAWEEYLQFTWVPVGSDYDWKPDTKKKVLYRLTDVQRIPPFRVSEGIRHGRVWMEYYGKEV